ncbi:MAG: HEAT repeat domain-containing protein [Desulfuromonadales bacterium]|nr:HEAT repeat domain-containing protein [Desulfuromonadales bacterium]
MTTANSREKIAALMASADEEARLEGIRSLTPEAAGSLLDLVFQGFGDVSWRVRKEATDLFLRLPANLGLVGEIIELLHAEENAGLRNAAVDILVRMGRDAVPMLLDQARCPDHDVRKFIVDILGEIADPRAVPKLLEALDDEDGNVRAAAAENLGKLRAGEAVPKLLDAMRYPDVLLRFTILDALGKIGMPVPLSRLLPFRDEKLLRKALIDCLGLVGDASAVAELLAGLTDPMRNVRDASLSGLVALAERYPEAVRQVLASQNVSATVEAVLGYLEDGQPAASRRAAVRVLGWLASPRALLPLLQTLVDESLQRDALPALINIAAHHPQSAIEVWGRAPVLQQAYLAYVYGEARCAGALPLLHAALNSDDLRLTQMAAHALGRLGGVAELAPLAACLRHASADVRDAAAHSLGTLGGCFPTEMLAVLEPLLSDADPARRSAAIGVLGRLDEGTVAHRLAMALKDPAAEVRRAAIRALPGTAADDYLLTIQLALTDEDLEVRRAAAEILGTSSNPEAMDGLRLALRDEDLWVRAAAVRSLGRLGGEGEAETISQLLADPVGLVSIAALETLAELLGERACPQMCAALDHPDEEVVNVALGLLSRHGAGPWLTANAEILVNHPAWNVRVHCLRLLPELMGERARPLLERRLAVESDEMVRQQISGALQELSAS